MKIRVIQPPYPKKPDETAVCVQYMVNQLNECDSSVDLVLLPECCNAPSGCGDSSLLRRLAAENTDILLNAASSAAKRCSSLVGINLYVRDNEGMLRNTTVLYGKDGNVACSYDKIHLPVSEYTNKEISHSYIEKTCGPTVVDIDGIRISFMTCYDMYYTEMMNRISMESPDIVLVCSLQRAERPDILEAEVKTLAFLCNSYVVRSSFFMGEDSTTGGCSMVCTPDGHILNQFGKNCGHFDCEVKDIHFKHFRSNGYGQPSVNNITYQTLFRAPWTYRVGGSGVCIEDSKAGFPRLCAFGGFSKGAPAYTIQSAALAISFGAKEVQLEVHCTNDGVPVVCPSSVCAENLSIADFRNLKVTDDFDGAYANVHYNSLKEYFAKFPCRTIFNLRVCDSSIVSKIKKTADSFDCTNHYFISSPDIKVLEIAEPGSCFVANSIKDVSIIESDCLTDKVKRVEIPVTVLEEDYIETIHSKGFKCYVSGVEDPNDSKVLLASGADCVVTNNYLEVQSTVKVF